MQTLKNLLPKGYLKTSEQTNSPHDYVVIKLIYNAGAFILDPEVHLPGYLWTI